MSVNQITKFEQLNNISVNVYSFEERKKTAKEARCTIFPLRLTNRKRDRHINLLYMQDQGCNNLGHFAWIKNLSRLVSMQLSKPKAKRFICDRERLETHMIDCQQMHVCAILLPSEDNK